MGKGRGVLKLGAHLVLSRGEESSGGRERPSALADTFEAVLGAIFLDGGFTAAEQFVERHFREAFGELAVIPSIENPKGELQELLQANFPSSAPQGTHVISTSGPDHDRIFECTVHHEGRELARGQGKSKKAAESEAALAALEKLRSEQPESSELNCRTLVFRVKRLLLSPSPLSRNCVGREGVDLLAIGSLFASSWGCQTSRVPFRQSRRVFFGTDQTFG